MQTKLNIDDCHHQYYTLQQHVKKAKTKQTIRTQAQHASNFNII